MPLVQLEPDQLLALQVLDDHVLPLQVLERQQLEADQVEPDHVLPFQSPPDQVLADASAAAIAPALNG